MRSLILVSALSFALPLAAQGGAFSLVDSKSVPGPADNMVVVERGRAQYTVTLSVTGNQAHVHQVAADGTLTAASTAATGSSPRAIVMARKGDFAVIANSASDDLSVMAIGGSGALTEVGRYPSGGDNPFDVAVGFGDLVVVANRDSDSVALFAIDKHGAMTQRGSHPTHVDPHVVAIGPQGVVAVANSTSNDLTIFDLDRDGNMALVDAAFAVGGSPRAVAFDPRGHSMFVAIRSPGVEDRIQAYEVDRVKGKPVLTAAGSVACGAFLTDIEVTNDNAFAVTVHPTTLKNEVRAFARRGTELTPVGTLELPGVPSFQAITSARVPGPIDYHLFVTAFQAGSLHSIFFSLP